LLRARAHCGTVVVVVDDDDDDRNPLLPSPIFGMRSSGRSHGSVPFLLGRQPSASRFQIFRQKAAATVEVEEHLHVVPSQPF